MSFLMTFYCFVIYATTIICRDIIRKDFYTKVCDFREHLLFTFANPSNTILNKKNSHYRTREDNNLLQCLKAAIRTKCDVEDEEDYNELFQFIFQYSKDKSLCNENHLILGFLGLIWLSSHEDENFVLLN